MEGEEARHEEVHDEHGRAGIEAGQERNGAAAVDATQPQVIKASPPHLFMRPVPRVAEHLSGVDNDLPVSLYIQRLQTMTQRDSSFYAAHLLYRTRCTVGILVNFWIDQHTKSTSYFECTFKCLSP